MKRSLVLVEGQTEERFIKVVLQDHFLALSAVIIPTILTTKRVMNGPNFKGGVSSFRQFERDALRLLGGDTSALITTMLDYYQLPLDFPGMTDRPNAKPADRVQHVEKALHQHSGNRRNFLPYLALHEYEALLFSSRDELPRTMMLSAAQPEFVKIIEQFGTPEDINEHPGYSPSKRIEAIFPGYRKTIHGPLVSKRIGLQVMREKCPHFNEWVARLEAFATRP
jgi:hypothetical protein